MLGGGVKVVIREWEREWVEKWLVRRKGRGGWGMKVIMVQMDCSFLMSECEDLQRTFL